MEIIFAYFGGQLCLCLGPHYVVNGSFCAVRNVMCIILSSCPRDGPRSAVSVRGRGGGHWRDQDGRPGYNNRNYNNRGGGPHRGQHQQQRQRQFNQQQPPQERSFPPGYGYNRPMGRGRPQERRIPIDAMR